MQYKLLSKKTKLLKQDQIIKICKLKNTHWKYGLNSNLEWFKKHVKSEDVHNLLYYKSKLIGYTLLRLRTLNATKRTKCLVVKLVDTKDLKAEGFTFTTMSDSVR